MNSREVPWRFFETTESTPASLEQNNHWLQPFLSRRNGDACIATTPVLFSFASSRINEQVSWCGLNPPREFRWLPWIVLSGTVALYLSLVAHLHPTNFFGLSQDDTLYFSSAKAIAEGRGYILPSVPGSP